jgi:hypothetical protein
MRELCAPRYKLRERDIHLNLVRLSSLRHGRWHAATHPMQHPTHMPGHQGTVYAQIYRGDPVQHMGPLHWPFASTAVTYPIPGRVVKPGILAAYGPPQTHRGAHRPPDPSCRLLTCWADTRTLGG